MIILYHPVASQEAAVAFYPPFLRDARPFLTQETAGAKIELLHKTRANSASSNWPQTAGSTLCCLHTSLAGYQIVFCADRG